MEMTAPNEDAYPGFPMASPFSPSSYYALLPPALPELYHEPLKWAFDDPVGDTEHEGIQGVALLPARLSGCHSIAEPTGGVGPFVPSTTSLFPACLQHAGIRDTKGRPTRV